VFKLIRSNYPFVYIRPNYILIIPRTVCGGSFSVIKGREGFEEARRDGQGRGSTSLVFVFVTVATQTSSGGGVARYEQPGHFPRQECAGSPPYVRPPR
jgi:hypothetical protein